MSNSLIQINVQPELKNFLIARLLTAKYSKLGLITNLIVALAVIQVFVLINLIDGWFQITLTFFVLYVFYFFMTPTLNYLILKHYHKVKAINYFYDKDTYGWEVNENRMSLPATGIKEIKVGKKHILNITKSGPFVFFGSEKVIAKAADTLKTLPAYKELVVIQHA